MVVQLNLGQLLLDGLVQDCGVSIANELEIQT